MVVFKNPSNKTQIVHFARHFYLEDVSSFRKTYLDVYKDPHLFILGLDESINDFKILKINFAGETGAFILTYSK